MAVTAGPTVTVAARIPREMRDDLDQLAKSTGRNKNALLEEALRRFIEVEKWQLADIEAGLREANAGDFATDEEIEAVFNEYAAYRDQGEDRRAD